MAFVGALVGHEAAPCWDPFGDHGRIARFRLEDTDATFFRQYLNDSFMVQSAGATPTQLVLARIVERPVTKNVEQFALIFHAAPGQSIPDGTYPFQHAALGDFELFIVAVGIPNERRAAYQACFSRHRSAATSVA
jgi:hypothetical protein